MLLVGLGEVTIPARKISNGNDEHLLVAPSCIEPTGFNGGLELVKFEVSRLIDSRMMVKSHQFIMLQYRHYPETFAITAGSVSECKAIETIHEMPEIAGRRVERNLLSFDPLLQSQAQSNRSLPWNFGKIFSQAIS